MSDVGRYATAVGELVTALTSPAISIDGRTPDVKAYRRISNLLEGVEGIRKPVVGVAPRRVDRPDRVWIGSRQWEARVTFEIAVVGRSERGSWDAEPWVDKALETLHDRIQNLASTQSGSLFQAMNEEYVEAQDPAVCAAVSTWELVMILGQ